MFTLKVTTFTQANQAFPSANKEEFPERFQTLLLKKNLHLNGFMTMGMIIWTPDAYEEQHFSLTV